MGYFFKFSFIHWRSVCICASLVSKSMSLIRFTSFSNKVILVLRESVSSSRFELVCFLWKCIITYKIIAAATILMSPVENACDSISSIVSYLMDDTRINHHCLHSNLSNMLFEVLSYLLVGIHHHLLLWNHPLLGMTS